MAEGLQNSDSTLRLLADWVEDAENIVEDMEDAVHVELLNQMHDAEIKQVTGQLARSLRLSTDKMHVWNETEDGYEFGTLHPAATYASHLIPDVDVDAVIDVIAAVLERES